MIILNTITTKKLFFIEKLANGMYLHLYHEETLPLFLD